MVELAMRWTLAVVVLGVVACKGPAREGETCSTDKDCMGDLVCKIGSCRAGAVMHEKMAKQSGVKVESERPAISVGLAGAVRVRSARGQGHVFAMCAADERLIGGWCLPPGYGGDSASIVTQGAGGYSKEDTLGAHWKCEWRQRVEAFALCQKVALPEN
jgi:hypothetical protein